MYKILNIPSRTVDLKDGEYLWFGGTGYLGMGHNAEFQTLLVEGLAQAGSSWGSSRNNTLQLEVYNKLELFLAAKADAPGALTVSSGMLAGQLVLKFLKETYLVSTLLYAPRVHPALWESNISFEDKTVASFLSTINQTILNDKNEIINIVIDAISSPHFENYDFTWVKNLPVQKQINLIIDDSHSFGVLNNGTAIYSQIVKAENVNLIVVSSLNKALGVPGGVIFGEKKILETLRKNTFFAACSPMPPAYAYACASAGHLYDHQLGELLKNIVYFNAKIPKLKPLYLANYPAYCFEQQGLAAYLLSQKIIVPSFGYPNPTDMPITRLVISSLHTKEDLDYLINKINDYENKLKF